LPARDDPSRPLSKAAIEKSWRRIRRCAGIPDVRLHDLRHTVGTYAGQSGANAFLVRDLLRHKDLSMTGRYVNRADDPVRALSDKVGERIAAGLAGRKSAQIVALK
jgi:integrase